jgi:hypothetical protein
MAAPGPAQDGSGDFIGARGDPLHPLIGAAMDALPFRKPGPGKDWFVRRNGEEYKVGGRVGTRPPSGTVWDRGGLNRGPPVDLHAQPQPADYILAELQYVLIAPDAQHPEVENVIRCPACEGCRVSRDGWGPARRACGTKGLVIVFSYGYRCPNCPSASPHAARLQMVRCC